MHIASIDYAEFYRPAFSDVEEARKFVERVEAEQSRAKVVLHQAARMLWLADRMDDVARARPALQILFFIIASEAVAKMVFNFQGEGQSRYYVHRFFEELCDEEHRKRLSRAFTTTKGNAVDYLYNVRCDVVHEGIYFNILGDPLDNISAYELRQMVLKGAVQGCRMLLSSDTGCI